MPTPPGPLDRIEVLQGTLDLVILQTLRWGPLHGYGISQMIRSSSREALQVETGSLYPALHRLEKRGWVGATWRTSEKGQRVREYALTERGRQQLAVERTKWERFTEAMAAIMTPPAEAAP